MSFFDRIASFFRGAPEAGAGTGGDPAESVVPIDRPIGGPAGTIGPIEAHAGGDPAGAIIPIDRPIGGPAGVIGPIDDQIGGPAQGVAPIDAPVGGGDPGGAIGPLDDQIGGPGGGIGPIDDQIGGPGGGIGPVDMPGPIMDTGIVAPSDMPGPIMDTGGGDPAGSFFDAPAGDTDLAGVRFIIDKPTGDGGGAELPRGDGGAVSFGPKHEDPSMPAPEGDVSTVGGPGDGGEGPDWAGTGAVSIGPKHDDPGPPPPDSSQSIGPKPEDPLAAGGGTESTVVGPGGGGPGDVGALSTVGEPGGGGPGDVGNVNTVGGAGAGGGPHDAGALAGNANQADDGSLMDDGPSTLLGDDGLSGFDTEMMPADLTDVGAAADFDAGSMLEP